MERDPHNQKIDISELSKMSAERIAEELERALERDLCDEETIAAYLDALDEKAPMPDMPDADAAYERFMMALQTENRKENVAPKRSRKRGRWLVGLAAVVALLLVAGCAAQIAGVDVFGAVARWTDSIFSFGVIRADGAENGEPEDIGSSGTIQSPDRDNEFETLQDALDYYVITEVKAPAWMPDGYAHSNISVTSNYDFGIFSLHASYEGSGDTIGIGIMRYTDEPIIQAEKSEELVDTFEANGVTFYVLDNQESFTVAWCTENFECYIYGANREALQKIAESMI